jgi:signal transduction histidine kinase
MAGETAGTFYARTGPDDVLRIGTFVASQTTPFYVTVAYDDDYLRARYMGFFYALALCWSALTVGIVAAAYFIQRLETVKRQAQFEIVNSAAAERQNISADMHDSIGASLAALLASLATGNIDVAEVKRKVGEVLMELRFLVDSSEPIDGDIGLLLGNVRHRMGGGIELAGIAFDWQVGELPAIDGLTARDTLAVKLVLMEAFSNVLHHSKATAAKLSAHYDKDNSTIVIAVCDNGRGFDEATTVAGRGLSNMRKRIATVSTGATIAIESAPGHGTTVRIVLKVPRG